MTTTTYALIRENVITKIKALTPTLVQGAGHEFDRCPRHARLREWASAAPGSAFRRFEVERLAASPDPHILDSAVIERNELARITVAYPVQRSLYGALELDSLDDVMRSDAKQIRDAVFSPLNYLAGQSAAFVTIEEPDRGEGIWYQPLLVQLIYYESQTI